MGQEIKLACPHSEKHKCKTFNIDPKTHFKYFIECWPDNSM